MGVFPGCGPVADVSCLCIPAGCHGDQVALQPGGAATKKGWLVAVTHSVLPSPVMGGERNNGGGTEGEGDHKVGGKPSWV